MSQPILFADQFRTARPARLVYCHQEFLDKLAARRNEPVGKRVALLMRRMAVDISRLHYKGASGVNRGWRRSRLGGSSGSHFYAWWAPPGAAPLKPVHGFEHDSEAIFLRDIRHHDDHTPLSPGDLAGDYLPLSVPDLRGEEYAPEPWTTSQARFVRSRGVARILKGHPGSGKTTALLHAADASQAARVLYLTFSNDLAALARDYFDRFCSNTRQFTVLTYPAFLRQMLGGQGSEQDPAESRARFRRDLANYRRSLASWSENIDALYDEMHAHLLGPALPEKSGRFPKAEKMRLPESAYRTQRSRYLGNAADGVIEAARWLDRNGEGSLMDRYFPDLGLAWRTAQRLASGSVAPEFLDFGCIAVDEIQDLTPLETFVVLALARELNVGGRSVPVLLAGDEAQTVRPTDFEWAWLNDMLHTTLSQPQEFKLSVNLRSPRRIADVVNRAWDFYDVLHKQDRPSGTGYAEIDDDSPDQILYAAVPSAELPQLLRDLALREGLALIAFDKTNLPKETLPFVLSPAEAKGLDFHSVCLLNGGSLLRRIVAGRAYSASHLAADTLAKRLAIDQLRVALSRPSERLFWVDASPDGATVQEVSRLLRPPTDLALLPMTAEALRTCLEEEELEVEDRLQRCQRDARQLVSVKPDMAWSRAQQAVSLLGTPGDLTCIIDPVARETAYLTLAEVCFQLAFQKKSLSPELGRLDLYQQAAEAARGARKPLLANAMEGIGAAERTHGLERVNRIATAIQQIAEAREQLPAWFIVEISARANDWLEELGRHLDAGDNPLLAQRILPPFFDAMGFSDAQARKDRLANRAIQILMKNRRHAQALTILERLPEAKRSLAAECYEETGQFAKAATIYLELGDRDKALKCYRSVPDFAAAVSLVREMEGHAARPSLEWLAELDGVLARRPENFNRTMTPPEKKLLEGMLERGLGVQRKKPAAKKAASPSSQKKAGPKRTLQKRKQ